MKLLKVEENKSGRDFFVGDLHGHYDMLMERLKEVRFDKSADRVFSVGDLVDRGPKSLECLALTLEPWFFAVQGNHEQLMRDGLNGGNAALWMGNGGTWIVDYDLDVIRGNANALLPNIPLAIEVPFKRSRIGVIHADVTSGKWGTFDFAEDVWSRVRFGRKGLGTAAIEGIDLVVVGHTPVEKPALIDNVYNIDTGAFFSGNLTLIEASDLPLIPGAA